MTKLDLTLYLGGTRSGKSARAEEDASRDGVPVLYVATARSDDVFMADRIRQHRARRPSNWLTQECSLNVAEYVEPRLSELMALSAAQSHTISPKKPVVLLDCVTLWVTAILFSLPDQTATPPFETALRAEVGALLKLMERPEFRWVMVSGEVGLGGIHGDAISRNFCDGLGLVNQMLGSRASHVYLAMAGRRLRLE